MATLTDGKHKRSTLTDEQRIYLQHHRVMSIPQLHQLASQIKALRRIRDQLKTIGKTQTFHYRPSAPSAPLAVSLAQNNFLTAASKAQNQAAKHKQPDKKMHRTSKIPSSGKRKRQSAKQDREEEEEEDKASAAESDSEPDGERPSRDIALRPRSKRVSFNLDDVPFEDEMEFNGLDHDSQEGSGSDGPEGTESKKKRKKRRKSSSSHTESVIEVVGDEPAQLIAMQPVKLQWDSDDEACNVCGDAEQVEGNEILLCDGEGCDVAVHQSCYAVPRVPRGKWFCDACKDKLDLTKPNCVCCPVLGGALRKVPSLGPIKAAPGYSNKKPYLHLACALWTPEILISDPEGMRNPKLDALRQHRVDLTCAICKQGGGSVIQCGFGVCCRSFHALCGRHAKAAAAFRHTDGHPLAFCVQHSKERYQRTREKLIAGDDVEPTASQDLDLEESASAAAAEAVQHEPNEYEVQRQRNIERNKQMLLDLKRKEL